MNHQVVETTFFKKGDRAPRQSRIELPEFYVRPNNAAKAYTFNRAINIIECLREL